MNVLLNAAAFQLLWLAIVLGVAHGHEWAGVGMLAAWIPVHLWLSPTPRHDLLLTIGLALAGPLLDTALMHAGLLGFKGSALLDGLAPVWLAALWANFGLTLNHSMRWIGERPLLAALFGAIGGPMAYYAGQRLGGVQLAQPLWQPLAALAAAWGLVLAALAWIAGPRRNWAEMAP